MRRVLWLVFLVAVLNCNTFGDVFAVLPVETTGFRADRSHLFYSRIVDELLKKGHKVVDLNNLNKVLKTWEYNLSEVVGFQDKEMQLGNMLQAKYLMFFSFVWNGQYTLIDVHLTDIVSNAVIFQRAYTTTYTTEAVADKGIPGIIDESFGIKSKTAIFSTDQQIQRDDNTNKVIRWARQRGISVIVYTFVGGVDGIDANSDYNKKYKPEKLKYYNSIDAEILKEYSTLRDQGEFVKLVHLGSLDKYTGYQIADNSVTISYEFPSVILAQPNVGVIFFGKRSESAKIESYLSKAQLSRYWFKYSWDESW